MRIIIDARPTQDEIRDNGVGHYTKSLIMSLVENYPDTKFVLIMYDYNSTLDNFLSTPHSNLEVVKIGKYFNGRGLDLIIHNMDIGFQVRSVLTLLKIKQKGDIFLCPYFMRGIPSLIIPTFVTIHDFALVELNIYSVISPVHNFLRWFYYWWQMLPIYLAKGILSDSEYTTQGIFKYLPLYAKKKVHTVYLGINLENIETDITRHFIGKEYRKNYFIYIGGGTTKNKNSEGVIRGYADFVGLLKERGFTEFPYLVIAGKNFVDMNNKEVRELHDLGKSLEIYEQIVFTGRYEDIERYSLLNNAIASIHLSLLEGFGFSAAESMRAKITTIAHNGSCYPDVLKDGAILVNGENSMEVAQAMFNVYTNPKYAHTIIQKGYEISLLYDWKNTAAQTFQILTSI